jgi:hypothetical protein
MRVSPHKFLAVALAGGVLAAFCRPLPEPEGPPITRGAEDVGAGFPDIVPLRIEAKRLIARDAAGGRRTLVEAAALFGALNRLPPPAARLPDYDPDVSHSYLHIPMRTEEERLCRQVVAFAWVALGDGPPGRAREAVARLEAEFFAELRARGTIRLPAPPPPEPVEELLRQARAALPEQQRGRSARGADR